MTQPKLTVAADAETPSEAVVNAARKVVEVTDALGRRLKVRKLNAMLRLDLAKLIGAADITNPAVMGPCTLAFAVTEIDGDQLYQAATFSELRGVVGKLDDEGLEAVERAYVEAGWVDAAASASVDSVKNS